jgi:ribosomal protein S18 acetylase RimI-like enzyme
MNDGSEGVLGRRRFRIRNARASDAAAISECLEAAFARHREQYTPDAYADTVLNSDGALRRLEEICLFVAVSDGQLVGTIGCKLNGREGHLRGMAVLPDWQGTGVASALLSTAETELEKRGAAFITLDTTEPLARAIRFYQRHGYSPSGRVTSFFGMPLYEYRKGLH